MTTSCSDYIWELFRQKEKLVANKDIKPVLSKHKYINCIVNSTLSFIMGQAVQSLNGDELYNSTQIVKASAAEFMELILNSIKDLPDLSREIKHMIINPVITTLSNAVANGNDAEQVHLLNLLRIILFEGEFWHPKMRSKKAEEQNPQMKAITANAKNLFEQPLFMKCIIDGIKNPVAFVRYHYIQFAQKIIPFMKEIVPSDLQV